MFNIPSMVVRARPRLPHYVLATTCWASVLVGRGESASVVATSPNGHDSITLIARDQSPAGLQIAVKRHDRETIRFESVGPRLSQTNPLADTSTIADVQSGSVNDEFDLPWGKTKTVVNRCSTATVTLVTANGSKWQIELRAYDDGVAFRYIILKQDGKNDVTIEGETTTLAPIGNPTAIFNTLDSFTTSHESLYDRRPVSDVPADRLIEMPFLLTWTDGSAAAVTEARVRHFAGGYLQKTSKASSTFEWKLSPNPVHKGLSVVGDAPVESPWRVVLLGDVAGKLLESNLLLCLNDPPRGDFSWATPGKQSFHWWYGAFEDDFKLADESPVFLQRHKDYIDFCAKNNIAYHSVSGDGLAWYPQSNSDYGTPKPDADVRTVRPELKLPEIIAYACQRGVRIRLWVHWKPLSKHLEEAFTLYESWGIAGLMVDFLDRDDQQMIDFTERMLESAARHKLSIQIHGSSKFSGEQRTFPNLFNREGVLNLEYDKWNTLCTPQHAVNVAYVRALAGPVDFHLGGFRSASRAEFQPRDRAPLVMGTRCHHLALYVVYENPMPMVADAPSSYAGQEGFDFIRDVPTTWDDTRFVLGDPGEYIALARRHEDTWYLSGITNWTARELKVPLEFLGARKYQAKIYADGSLDESKPNLVKTEHQEVNAVDSLHVALASGGGFVAVLKPQ